MKKQARRKSTRSTVAKRTAKKTVAKKTPVKRATASRTTASRQKTTATNPFKGADLVKQNKTTYNVQTVVVGANGLSIKSKSIKRTKANDAKFAQLKKSSSR